MRAHDFSVVTVQRLASDSWRVTYGTTAPVGAATLPAQVPDTLARSPWLRVLALWHRRDRRGKILIAAGTILVACLLFTCVGAGIAKPPRPTPTAAKAQVAAAAISPTHTPTSAATATPTRPPTLPPATAAPPSPTPFALAATLTKAAPVAMLPPTTIPATTVPPTTVPATAIPPTVPPAAPILVQAQVVDIPDAATIKVRMPDGTEALVLLIGIDSPLRSECYGTEAAARTTALLERGTVELEADARDKDAAGRLLRYAWVWGQDGIRRHINVELAKGGLADVYQAAPNSRYQAELDAAQKAAKSQGLGLWGACGKAHAAIKPTPTPLGRCASGDAQRLINTLQSKAQEWDDAVKLANSTPRIALAPQVQNLQRIRREAAALSVPSCGAKSQALMLAYMDTAINAFIDFLGQGSQYNTLIAQSNTQFDAFIAELTHVTIGP